MTIGKIQIKETESEDFVDIIAVETLAFGSEKEAKLTAELLSDETARPMISLLAFRETEAIGHILFTRAYINKMTTDQPLIHILAPLAIKPGFQKQGIGGLLIREGLKKLKEMGSETVFVLGHMDYYPRHGFIPDAKKAGFPAPFPIPGKYANAWMIQPFNPTGSLVEKGNVLCAEAMNRPEHWRE